MKQRWLFLFTNGEFKEEEEEEEERGKSRRTVHVTLNREDALAQLKEKLSFARYFSFSLYQPSFFSLLLLFPSFLNENQPFDSASLILFFLPRKNLYPRLASLAVSSPLSVRWSSHFSFVARRKVHFSRVTCRQRYKGIFRASANIT